MNILPKKYSQFKEKAYWDSFFLKLKSKHQNLFEWYGSLPDFKAILMQILHHLYNRNHKNKSFRVFHVGCGNSTFAQDIVTAFGMFTWDVTNCDYSEAIVSDMRKRLQKSKFSKQQIKYEICDLLQPLEQKFVKQFNLVVDKGTLDALLPEESQQNLAQIQLYFKNLEQSLNPQQGSLIVISMLQSFILNSLLDYFYQKQGFAIKIYEAWLKESQLQPFVVEIRYSSTSKDQNNMVEISCFNKQVYSLTSKEQVLMKIQEMQIGNQITSQVQELREGQHLQFDIFHPQTHQIRFMLDILDSSDQKILTSNNCAVFIVPQGQQFSPLFNSQTALASLAQQVATSRMIVVKLPIGNIFEDLNSVKAELNSVLKGVVQRNCKLEGIPFLTDGEALGKRAYLFEDDQMYIEEVLIRNEGFRRLIFKSSPQIIQCSFKLAYQSQLPSISSAILPKKQQMYVGIDKSSLPQEQCRIVVSAIVNLQPIENISVLHLGGVGCEVASFLFTHYKVKQTIVEENRKVMEESKKYFDFPANNQHFEYREQNSADYLKTNERLYNVIVVNTCKCSEEGSIQFPPAYFFSEDFIASALSHLCENGLLIWNVLPINSDLSNAFEHLNQISHAMQLYLAEIQKLQHYVMIITKRPNLALSQSICLQKGVKHWDWEEQALLQVKHMKQKIKSLKDLEHQGSK